LIAAVARSSVRDELGATVYERRIHHRRSAQSVAVVLLGLFFSILTLIVVTIIPSEK
jgi:hypothetical protein